MHATSPPRTAPQARPGECAPPPRVASKDPSHPLHRSTAACHHVPRVCSTSLLHQHRRVGGKRCSGGLQGKVSAGVRANTARATPGAPPWTDRRKRVCVCLAWTPHPTPPHAHCPPARCGATRHSPRPRWAHRDTPGCTLRDDVHGLALAPPTRVRSAQRSRARADPSRSSRSAVPRAGPG
jgi:hypothetical protein